MTQLAPGPEVFLGGERLRHLEDCQATHDSLGLPPLATAAGARTGSFPPPARRATSLGPSNDPVPGGKGNSPTVQTPAGTWNSLSPFDHRSESPGRAPPHPRAGFSWGRAPPWGQRRWDTLEWGGYWAWCRELIVIAIDSWI